IAESSELAIGDELLRHHRLLLVLCAFFHKRLDRLVVLVLAGAAADRLILLAQALLALGLRCIELLDSGLAIILCALFAGAGRDDRTDESENRNATKNGLGHRWFPLKRQPHSPPAD